MASPSSTACLGKDVADQNCLTIGDQDLVANLSGDETDSKGLLLQDFIGCSAKALFRPRTLEFLVAARRGPQPTQLVRFASEHPPDRSICGQDQLRVHRFGS